MATLENEVKNLKEAGNQQHKEIKSDISKVEKKIDSFFEQIKKKADKTEVEKINVKMWGALVTSVIALLGIIGFLLKQTLF